jgi:cold shock protein
VITAVVRWYSDRDGWGVLDAPEAPGGIFVAFPAIQMEGFKHLVAGQRVEPCSGQFIESNDETEPLGPSS